MIHFIRLVVLLAVLVTAVMNDRPAAAQLSGTIIERILVEGNQRIEPETIRSYMTSIAVGDPFDRQRIDRALKELFKTGLFGDVT